MGGQLLNEVEVRSRLERTLNNILHCSHKVLTDPAIMPVHVNMSNKTSSCMNINFHWQITVENSKFSTLVAKCPIIDKEIKTNPEELLYAFEARRHCFKCEKQRSS